MSRPHIVVATPCFGGLVTQTYMMSVLRLSQRAATEDFDLDVIALGGDALISRARSILVSHMLDKPRATHLLFVDADIAFESDQLVRLLRFDKDFVAGLYPLKRIDWQALPARVVEGEPLDAAGLSYVGHLCEAPALQIESGFATALYAGTGFQLIKRHVFERMAIAYPELRFTKVDGIASQAPPDANLYALFDCMIDPASGTYLSEDYAFCRRWRGIGGDIWLDLESRLTHAGTQHFVGDTSRRFASLRASFERDH